MKNLFLIIKKRSIFIVLAVVMAVAGAFAFASIKTSSMPKPEYSIVIDAGHGGLDVK